MGPSPNSTQLLGSGTGFGLHWGRFGSTSQGSSTAVPCTATVNPFQNSLVELRHVTVSNALHNRHRTHTTENAVVRRVRTEAAHSFRYGRTASLSVGNKTSDWHCIL